MVSTINETGFWSSENAHVHHIHSNELSNFICELLNDDKNKSTFDFGCGLGDYIKKLNDTGHSNLLGLEGDPPAKKHFENIIKQDLTTPFNIGLKGNVICLEVGEHIPNEYMYALLSNIKTHLDGYLIMSWAVKGQAGYGHVNCLDNTEIIQIITEFMDVEYIEPISQAGRSIIGDNTPWFKNTLLIFKSK